MFLLRYTRIVADYTNMQRTPRIHHENLGPDREIALTGEALRHLKVLRIQPHESVILFNEKGEESDGIVLQAGASEAKVRVGKVRRGLVPKANIGLAVGAPKGERFDWMVEKAAELGISELWCMKSERSIVAPSAAKLERASRIAQEAAAQSGRCHFLQVGRAQKSFQEILHYGNKYGLRLLADPTGERLLETLQKVSKDIVPNGVLCLVGPEGGFSAEEQKAAVAAGFVPVRLNPAVLRTETAAITLAAQLTGILE
jgi:16S rRNA (uracil1498-N3)-methyltransferase